MSLHDIVLNLLFQVEPFVIAAFVAALAWAVRHALTYISAKATSAKILNMDGLWKVGRDLASLASIAAQTELSSEDGIARKARAEQLLAEMVKERTGIELSPTETDALVQLGYVSAKIALAGAWPKDAQDLAAEAKAASASVKK